MEKFKRNLPGVLLAFLVATLVVLFAFAPYIQDRGECESGAKSIGLEWRYSGETGCEVFTPDLGWENLDEYKVFATKQYLQGK